MKLYIATGNAHKVGELRKILTAQLPEVQVLGAEELGGMPTVVEDQPTFEGNALLKARALFQISHGSPVLADDSGLCVDVLEGAPGIYSARYAGENASNEENRQKLLHALEATPLDQRAAHFACVLAYIDSEGQEHTFAGTCPGQITFAEEGTGGFGYDPIFQPDGFDQTFGTLSSEIKNQLSHRAKALEKFIRFLKNGN